MHKSIEPYIESIRLYIGKCREECSDEKNLQKALEDGRFEDYLLDSLPGSLNDDICRDLVYAVKRFKIWSKLLRAGETEEARRYVYDDLLKEMLGSYNEEKAIKILDIFIMAVWGALPLTPIESIKLYIDKCRKECSDEKNLQKALEDGKFENCLSDLLPDPSDDNIRLDLVYAVENFNIWSELLSAGETEEEHRSAYDDLLKEMLGSWNAEKATKILNIFVMAVWGSIPLKLQVTPFPSPRSISKSTPRFVPSRPTPHSVPSQPTSQVEPTSQPTLQAEPTSQPTPQAEPTSQPTPQAEPTSQSTSQAEPTSQPTLQAEPTSQPTLQAEPTSQPTPQADPASQATQPRLTPQLIPPAPSLKGNGTVGGLRSFSYVAVLVGVICFLAFGVNYRLFQPIAENSSTPSLTESSYPSSSSSSSLSDVYRNKQVGERFYFGHYPQSANSWKKGPIEWRVLKREANSLLVISVQGLDRKCYNDVEKEITWSDCSLRRWLNDEFYKEAFNEQEQSLIKKATLANNAGPSTEDNVFLLSVDEAKSLFAGDNDRTCKPTGYAVEHGAYGDSNGNEWWWLRSRGSSNLDAALVSYDGCIGCDYSVNNSIASIRPALYLAI